MTTLDKRRILGYRPARRAIDIPELGGEVLVRELSALESQRLGEMAQSGSDLDITLATVIFSVVGEGGEPMFDDGDREALEKLPGRILRRIADTALRLRRGELDGGTPPKGA